MQNMLFIGTYYPFNLRVKSYTLKCNTAGLDGPWMVV